MKRVGGQINRFGKENSIRTICISWPTSSIQIPLLYEIIMERESKSNRYHSCSPQQNCPKAKLEDWIGTICVIVAIFGGQFPISDPGKLKRVQFVKIRHHHRTKISNIIREHLTEKNDFFRALQRWKLDRDNKIGIPQLGRRVLLQKLQKNRIECMLKQTIGVCRYTAKERSGGNVGWLEIPIFRPLIKQTLTSER